MRVEFGAKPATYVDWVRLLVRIFTQPPLSALGSPGTSGTYLPEEQYA
jgi:hypothetical protein